MLKKQKNIFIMLLFLILGNTIVWTWGQAKPELNIFSWNSVRSNRIWVHSNWCHYENGHHLGSPVNKPFPSEFKFDFKLSILVKLSIKVFSLTLCPLFWQPEIDATSQSLRREMGSYKFQYATYFQTKYVLVSRVCNIEFLLQ